MIVSGFECLTVSELIAHLQAMPPDAPCVFQMCSDYSALEAKQIAYVPPEKSWYAKRGNVVMEVDRNDLKNWGDEKPEFIGCVAFPGN